MTTLAVEVPSVEASEQAAKDKYQIAEGAYRIVYHVPGSKWVYKHEKVRWNGKKSGANKQEYINYLKFRNSLPKDVVFPEMHLLDNNVIAVEKVDGVLANESHRYYNNDNCVCASHGIRDCWTKMVRPMLSVLDDLHGANVMISRSQGKVYIIDIGEYGEDSDD